MRDESWNGIYQVRAAQGPGAGLLDYRDELLLLDIRDRYVNR